MDDLSHVRIDLVGADSDPPAFSLTVLDRALGALSESLETRVSDKLKTDFHRHCRQNGMDMSERVRELIALDTYGSDGVRSLLDKRLNVMGIGTRQPAQTVVPTAVTGPGLPN